VCHVVYVVVVFDCEVDFVFVFFVCGVGDVDE